ncbi:porphobilinogen synthase [Candidatus Uabimicrobium amorphum]|uniref:Delta-aminolevulinic acid dehydratase n=1 Tax=Uabimicrobium amorphum TaxID=2596890 RepID=A0A5S9IUQ1_UABAM|nr:porphobilinogen synthase [Candidatus Uabimicrobium amorphum]BBM87880.1 delta-aminolevulinic acid dehydratase [Candidatus Uabimicrobium amorphum]
MDITHRPRRLRNNKILRKMVRETHLDMSDFITPLFIVHGKDKKNPIRSMPGIFQFSLDRLEEEIEEMLALGLEQVILFGIPQSKDEVGSDSICESGIIQRSVRFLKAKYPELYVITDVCMCEYTDHGHCGIICEQSVDNDATLEYLQKQVVSHAQAGADMVAPSGMMDHMVAAIRSALDAEKFSHIPIMSYSVKYASSFYGPFRDAAESPPQFGDRKSYQMDCANRREAIKEAQLDIQQGADILMVKPALAYLDIIRELKSITHVPIACYNVSGEYSMVKAAAEKGWIDGEALMMETLLSMKRAGADIILTYFAKEAAKLLRDK